MNFGRYVNKNFTFIPGRGMIRKKGVIIMTNAAKTYWRKRGQVLVSNLQRRNFEAYYCDSAQEACRKALELIPEGSAVGWGGCTSAVEIGLPDAVRKGNYTVIDRDLAKTPAERQELMRRCLLSDVFIAGANAISLDGQMVNIDGMGNRVAAIVYGPSSVLVVAGMNKVVDTLEDAYRRAKNLAAPINQQRFNGDTPCNVTGSCGNCHSADCICNQILVTRNCRPRGRIKFIIVGEELGF